METKIVKFVSNFCATVLAAVVIVLTAKAFVSVMYAFAASPRDAGELYETAFGAWCGNWLVTVIAIVALAAFTARKDLKARIVSYGGILGMLASVFFGCVIIAAALYDGAYFKALGLAWFSCLVWFAFLIVTGSCVRYIRYGDTPDIADTAAGAA